MTQEVVYEKFFDIEDFPIEGQRMVIEYICHFCHGVIYEPVLDKNGCLFCKRCITKYLQINNNCPIDPKFEQNQSNLIEVTMVSSLLGNMKVHCRNRSKGCDWLDLVKSYNNHVENECEKQNIICTNEDCKFSCLRKDITQHETDCEYKKEKCPECLEEFPRIKFQHHEQSCPMKKISCEQACGETFERKLLEEHIKLHCPFSTVECVYKPLGCSIKVPKHSLKQHLEENEVEHQSLLVTTLNEAKIRIEDLTASNKKLELEFNKSNSNSSSTNIQNNSNNSTNQQPQLQSSKAGNRSDRPTFTTSSNSNHQTHQSHKKVNSHNNSKF
jgi:hypothetical protein